MTGVGLDVVRRYLHLLPPGASHKEQQKLEQNPPEFQIDEIFDVPGVGTVVGGNALVKKPFTKNMSGLTFCLLCFQVW